MRMNQIVLVVYVPMESASPVSPIKRISKMTFISLNYLHALFARKMIISYSAL